ncbi:MAG: hypothetical protein V3S37_00520 [Dehalococcoidia bacterium]
MALDAGVDGYLMKDSSRQELLKAVKKLGHVTREELPGASPEVRDCPEVLLPARD